jgi:hypothetical protein
MGSSFMISAQGHASVLDFELLMFFQSLNLHEVNKYLILGSSVLGVALPKLPSEPRDVSFGLISVLESGMPTQRSVAKHP